MLFAIAICACVNALSVFEQETTSKTASLKHSLISAITTKRSLRTQEGHVVNPSGIHSGVGDEERVNTGSLSKLAGLDKKTGLIHKVDMITNKVWASTKKDPERLFKLFGLHNAGNKIDEKKRVIQWFRYAVDYRATKGTDKLSDAKIYTILKKSEASEAKLAALFQSLKDIDDVKTLATTMQSYQFKRWIDQDSIPESIRNAAQNILFRNQVSLGTDNAETYKIAQEYAMLAFGPGAVLR
ncbi:Avirulence (Avh) protein [Phytophthora megakarya]|uniref:Avirulence (Avh) protein n=1 Tax=Phytophthora megakarya TaxID=4795 RepID=A0A225WEF3_9STRA|nr:Avirulence (Avh) protein [Phytophthora megakarya]